jgi:hypothetical protein
VRQVRIRRRRHPSVAVRFRLHPLDVRTVSSSGAELKKAVSLAPCSPGALGRNGSFQRRRSGYQGVSYVPCCHESGSDQDIAVSSGDGLGNARLDPLRYSQYRRASARHHYTPI